MRTAAIYPNPIKLIGIFPIDNPDLEVLLTLSPSLRRRPALLAVLACALLVAAVAVGIFSSDARAFAVPDPSNITCKGHISGGNAEPGDDDQQVAYSFACDSPITGYQIQSQIGDTGFDASTTVTGLDGNPVPTDAFNCAGDFPGYGINCTGTYSGQWKVVNGQFSIGTKLCDEPRVDPLLTVTYATADSKGVITQYISGPFDLGRPRGCKADSSTGKTRIPADGTVPTAPATTKKKASARKAKTRHAHTRAKASAHHR